MPDTRQPLILLPGLLCDAALWRHQSETLSDIADILIPDLTQDDTFADMARRILETAPARFALAGLSMGGYLAQQILRIAPERVTRLALIDTSARADAPEQRERREAMIDLAKSGKFRGVTARLLPMLIHQTRLDDDAVAGVVLAMAERVGRDAFIRQQHAIMKRPDGRDDLRYVKCPTLVLCGRQDALTPLSVHEEMAALAPRARLVVIEDCGHLAPLEQPHAASAVLRYWLQD